MLAGSRETRVKMIRDGLPLCIVGRKRPEHDTEDRRLERIDRGDGRGCGVGHGEDQVVCADTTTAQRGLECIRPAPDTDRGRDAGEICEGSLKCLDLFAEDMCSASKNPGDGGVDQQNLCSLRDETPQSPGR